MPAKKNGSASPPLPQPKAEQPKPGQPKPGQIKLPSRQKPARKRASTALRSLPAGTGTHLDKILDAAVEIQQNPELAERAYMARHLVQCTLPHSDPGNLPIWRRRNGDLTLSVRPHLSKVDDRALYPFGTIPRLLLFWLVTEATRTQSRRIKLGDNLYDFTRSIGLNPDTGGGKRGDRARLRDQMERLFRATISFDMDGPERSRYQDMQIAPNADLWWSTDGQRSTLWESWVELGESFYEAVVTSSVPVDLRALKALKRSPLALDLYAWLTYTVFAANKSRQARRVPWLGLHGQMGAEYKELRNFRREVLKAIAKIRLVFPGLKAESTMEHLVIHPGPLAITGQASSTKP